MNLKLEQLITCENVDLNKQAFFVISKKHKRKIIKINDLEITLKGEVLTQTHKDIIEAILIASDIKKLNKNGTFDVAFSISEVLRVLGHKHTKNYKWFNNKLEEIFFSGIKIEKKSKEKTAVIYAHVIEKYGYLRKTEQTINPKTGKGFIKENTYFGIKFTREFTSLVLTGILIRLNNEKRKELIQIKSIIVKSFIRYCLSFKELSEELIEILIEIGAVKENSSKSKKKKVIQEIIRHLEEIGNFGIKIQKCKKDKRKYCVFYKSNNQFFFSKENIADYLKEHGKDEITAKRDFKDRHRKRLKMLEKD